MRKWFVVIPLFLFLLSGCDKQNNVDFAYNHPELLKYLYVHCSQKTVEEVQGSQTCVMVFKQALLLQHYAQEFVSSPDSFGETIIRAQMKLADLNQEMVSIDSDDQKANYQKNISALQREIQKKRAIIGFYSQF